MNESSVSNLVQLLGGIAGVVSLLTIAYLVGFRFSKLETKVELLWKILIEDSLRQQLRQGYLSRGSPYAVTEKWKEEISPLRDPKLVKEVRYHLKGKRLPEDDAKLVYLIIKVRGWETVFSRSQEVGMEVQQYLAHTVASMRSEFHQEEHHDNVQAG